MRRHFGLELAGLSRDGCRSKVALACSPSVKIATKSAISASMSIIRNWRNALPQLFESDMDLFVTGCPGVVNSPRLSPPRRPRWVTGNARYFTQQRALPCVHGHCEVRTTTPIPPAFSVLVVPPILIEQTAEESPFQC